MAYSYVVYYCSCGTKTRYRAGQHFFYCTGCDRRYQANPRARIVSYSTRPDPRWRFKFKKYHYPNPNTTIPGTPAYYVPQTPPPTMTPADFHVTNPMPQPLPLPGNMPPMPGTAGMPPVLPTLMNEAAVIETAKKASAGKIIGGLLAAAAVIAIAATLINNNTGECAAARRALQSWSDCSPSERSGYNYCYVVNIYGDPGHGYVPKGCPSP
jgi:hypothetical protein